MADRKIYIGSVGPFIFDDSETINDPDGDFTGQTFLSFLANFQAKITQAPTGDDELIRWQDLALGIALPVGNKSGPGSYLVLDSDYFLFCDVSAGDLTLNFPSAIGSAGNSWFIKKIDSSLNSVIIDPFGSQTLDGELTVVIDSQWSCARITSDGTNLLIT